MSQKKEPIQYTKTSTKDSWHGNKVIHICMTLKKDIQIKHRRNRKKKKKIIFVYIFFILNALRERNNSFNYTHTRASSIKSHKPKKKSFSQEKKINIKFVLNQVFLFFNFCAFHSDFSFVKHMKWNGGVLDERSKKKNKIK